MPSFTLSSILSGIIFGSIGFVAFVYGKKMNSFRPMVLGIILMGYTYVLQDVMWQYIVGALLTIGLFFP